MRDKLKPLVKRRLEFLATAGTRGSYRTHRGKAVPTLCLEDVLRADTRELMSTHIWVDPRKWAWSINRGDIIRISARVSWYEKGHFDDAERDTDYTLARIKLLNNYGKHYRTGRRKPS